MPIVLVDTAGVAAWGNYTFPLVGSTRVKDVIFLGQGVGPTKPTQVVDGPTIAEELGIGDEIYARWPNPQDIDLTAGVTFTMHFYINAVEVGKVASFDMAIGISDSTEVTRIQGTRQAIDVAVSGQYLDGHAIFFVDASTYLSVPGFDGLHLRITRVASSNDPVAHPRVHLLTATETF